MGQISDGSVNTNSFTDTMKKERTFNVKSALFHSILIQFAITLAIAACALIISVLDIV